METLKIATVVSVLAAGVAVGLTCAIAAMAGRAITPEVVALPDDTGVRHLRTGCRGSAPTKTELTPGS